MDKSIPDELVKFIAEEAGNSGYQVVDVSSKGGKVTHIEVTLDKEGGISLGECGVFNQRVVSWIEERGLFNRGYTLDVCSPGLDRELKSDGDFSWAKGKEVVVNVRVPVGGKNSITGRLLEVSGHDKITLEGGSGGVVSIERKNIAKAKIALKIQIKPAGQSASNITERK